MKLPHSDLLRVERAKVVDYLLSPGNSRGKAAFFLRLGFDAARWEVLAEALKAQARANPVVTVFASPYGTRYGVDGEIVTPDGRRPLPNVRTVWMFATDAPTMRLITAHPAPR